MIKVKISKIILKISIILGDDVNVRAVVSSLQEKTRLHSKSKHILPTRMLKKTKQIKHVNLKNHFELNSIDFLISDIH
jgi:hypothetical protein